MIVKISPIMQKYKFLRLSSEVLSLGMARNPRKAVTMETIPAKKVNMNIEIAPATILINPYLLVNPASPAFF